MANWTTDEVEYLKSWYRDREGKSLELDKLAAELGRNKANVARKARAHGLTNQRRAKTETPNHDRVYREDGSLKCKRKPKFASREEANAHISRSRKQWLANNPHPRGMLGKKHTDANKQRKSEQTRRFNENRTAEEHAADVAKSNATKIERYGTAGPTFLLSENPHSRSKSGYCDDLPGIFWRSSWEPNYARYLEWLKGQGEIVSWEYEPETFVFHGVTRAPVCYTPDFKVVERDGRTVFHEVKGWMDSKSRSKLKRMKKFYPEVEIIVIGPPEYKAIKKWSGLIPFWGDDPVRKPKG